MISSFSPSLAGSFSDNEPQLNLHNSVLETVNMSAPVGVRDFEKYLRLATVASFWLRSEVILLECRQIKEPRSGHLGSQWNNTSKN
jgi:hypothetical protein